MRIRTIVLVGLCSLSAMAACSGGDSATDGGSDSPSGMDASTSGNDTGTGNDGSMNDGDNDATNMPDVFPDGKPGKDAGSAPDATKDK